MNDWRTGPPLPCPPEYRSEQVNLPPVMATLTLSPDQQAIVDRLDRLIHLQVEQLAAAKPGSRLSNADLTLVAETATQLSGTTQQTRSVHVQAHAGNTDVVLIGGPQVGAGQGYPLAAGQSVTLEIDDLNKVYVYSRVAATLSWMAVLP